MSRGMFEQLALVVNAAAAAKCMHDRIGDPNLKAEAYLVTIELNTFCNSVPVTNKELDYIKALTEAFRRVIEMPEIDWSITDYGTIATRILSDVSDKVGPRKAKILEPIIDKCNIILDFVDSKRANYDKYKAIDDLFDLYYDRLNAAIKELYPY